MRDLVVEAQPIDDPPPLTEERVLEAFSRYLAADKMSQLRSMVADGTTVALPQSVQACMVLEPSPVQVVDPGFDPSSLKTNRMTGVVESGPAFQAGIRNGQEVYRSSFWKEGPTKDVILGVTVDGQKKLIHLSSAKTVTILQYRRLPDCGAPKGP